MDGWMDQFSHSNCHKLVPNLRFPRLGSASPGSLWELWVLVTGVDITTTHVCIYNYLMLFYITLYHTILYCYSILL